jgi:hypothetical protein
MNFYSDKNTPRGKTVVLDYPKLRLNFYPTLTDKNKKDGQAESSTAGKNNSDSANMRFAIPLLCLGHLLIPEDRRVSETDC